MDLKKVNKISQKNKDTVFGFIRGAQAMLPDNNHYYNIVTLIQHLILFYFHYPSDKFDVFDAEIYQLSNEDKTVTNQGPSQDGLYCTKTGSCYGFMKINSMNGGIYRWKFCIETSKNSIGIGIADTTYAMLKTYNIYGYHTLKCPTQSKFYGIWTNNTASSWDKGNDTSNNIPNFGTDDTLTMELNLNKNKLAFWLNSNDKAVHCFENIAIAEDVCYSIILCVNVRNDCVTLLNYEESS